MQTRRRNREKSALNGDASVTNGDTVSDGCGSQASSSSTGFRHVRPKEISWNTVVKAMVLGCVAVYFMIPGFAPLLPFMTKQFLYLCLVKNPFAPSLQHPEQQDITGARNVHIGTVPPDPSIQLGMWQILPQSLQSDGSIQHASQFDAALGDGKPIILYLHGNAGSRAADHRLLLYRLLVGMDFHVVALDYRGFGDSSGWPTAQGVVDDAESSYRWVLERSKGAPIYVWGHSMGSGIGSAMVKKLCKTGLCPQGLILESPYNSMHDAMVNHPFTVPWRFIPGCLEQISKAYEQEETMFNTQENLLEVHCPVLIIHAEDDFVVPYYLGKRLYDYTVEHRDKSLPPVSFHNFGDVGFGHRHIVDSPDLPDVIRNFVKH